MTGTSVTNIARGGHPYRLVHTAIAQAIFSDPRGESLRMTSFTRDNLFKLKKENWFVLGFVDKDWKNLERLLAPHPPQIDAAYVSLAAQYVLANHERVKTLYSMENAISASILTDDGAAVASLLGEFDDIDRQSLFAFRVFGVMNAHSHEQLTSYFRAQLNTEWLRQRFLYPFVYYTINNPTDSTLDDFLSYVVPHYQADAQTATIKTLLKDDADFTLPIAFKAYVALLCHPYDACEVLLNHVELEFAETGRVSDVTRLAFDQIAAAISCPRIGRLKRTIDRHHYSFRSDASPAYLQQEFGINAATAKFYAEEHSLNCAPKPVEAEGRLKPYMERIRRNRYPTVNDFTVATGAARQWSFTEAGRFLNAYFASQ